MRTITISVILGHLWLSGGLRAEESARYTPTVRLIERVQEAVVPIFTQGEENGSGGAGSGVVIHPDGFILTADHVTRNHRGVALFGLERFEYQIIGRLPERDLAVVRVRRGKPLTYAPLGSSRTLKAGEPILVGGNPSGRGIVFSQGIVNVPLIDPSWPNMLVKSYWRNDMLEAEFKQSRSTGGRPEFIQFDAASNRGNSGGPLFNFDGEVMGIVAAKSFEEQGVSWAIPSSAIRLLMPYILQPEEQGDYFVGLELDPAAEGVIVSNVAADSPAWQAGLRPGDRLQRCNDRELRFGHDWLLALYDAKQGDRLAVVYSRDGTEQQVEIEVGAYPHSQETPQPDSMNAGVAYSYFKGRMAVIPDLRQREAARVGNVADVTSKEIVPDDEREFAIEFRGYLSFPEPGLYRVHLGSDDGSKLYLHDRLWIDNDLPHPYQVLSRWVRVGDGLIPFRLEYAETAGDKALSLSFSKDQDGKQKVPVKYFTATAEEK